MNDPKRNAPAKTLLPLDRVDGVGDYFKSLFVRSLRLGLDDGRRARPWEEAPVPADPCLGGADSAADRKTEMRSEEEPD